MKIHARFNQGLLILEMLWIKYFLIKPWIKSVSNPVDTQNKTLLRILDQNHQTSFGKKHNFALIKNIEDYKREVPILSYEELRPYIEELHSKELNKNLLMFLRTSGTTGQPKDIPLFRQTLATYKKIQKISCYYQYQSTKGVFSENLLGIVSPLIEGQLANGIAYGSMSGLVSQTLPKKVQAKFFIPTELLKVADYELRGLLIALCAASRSDITCLASANPSTFIKLSDTINKNTKLLLDYLGTGNVELISSCSDLELLEKISKLARPDKLRAEALTKIFEQRGCLKFTDLWPNLKAVITWTSGNCAILIPKLINQLNADVKIMDLGYIASEFWGTITVEHQRNSGVLTIEDNFFEFVEARQWESGQRDTVLIHQLESNKRYYIIATTANGLYRYFINDLVEVVGRYKNTPTIVFLQKGKGVTSLTGEKLYESQVILAIQQLSELHKIQIENYMLLADKDVFSYTLYLECVNKVDDKLISCELDNLLSEINLEYSTKLKSGRIAPVRVARVRIGTFEEYKKSAIQSGQREDQFKTIKLQYRDDVKFNFSEYECK